MTSVNRVIIIGNIGQDLELRSTKDGTPATSFSVATCQRRSAQDGAKEGITEWHNVVAFGQLAENCCRHLRKGSRAYVEGRLRTRSYQDSRGYERRVTEIVADRVGFLDPRTNQR